MTDNNTDETDQPEPPELRCQCCGGYAGHGFSDPEYCGSCRRAGEHLDEGTQSQDTETERGNSE